MIVVVPKKRGEMKEFKEFIMRGNLVELAVAFIMGAAFSKVVDSFTNIFLSLISLIFGKEPNFDAFQPFGLPLGEFLTAVTSFLIVSAVLFFLVVKPMNELNRRVSKDKEEKELPPTDNQLLTEIRDILSEKASK